MARSGFTIGHRTYSEPEQETDRSTDWLDGIGPDVCHMFPSGGAAAHCGVPRLEAPPHGVGNVRDPYSANCGVCGGPRCPRCVAAFERKFER